MCLVPFISPLLLHPSGVRQSLRSSQVQFGNLCYEVVCTCGVRVVTVLVVVMEGSDGSDDGNSGSYDK